jgi:hypothetical protein
MSRAGLRGTCVLLLCALAGCARPLPELTPSQVPEPATGEVESVIYLFGDAGYANEHRNPVLRRLRNDIEQWSGALRRDSAVVVVFLGDIVYPDGVHDADHPDFPRDSAIVQSQVNLLAGPAARAHRSAGYFVAGNHDWGNARDIAGVARLQNLERFLERRRAEGPTVSLHPVAGEPGPHVIDVGRQARLLLYDTAWWLLAQDTVPKQRMFRESEALFRGTDGRFIIVAAHHPFQSASAHGGAVPFWKTLGLRFLLARSGAILQDLNSIVYRELTRSLLNAFSARPPLIFAGGHDHALQVIASDSFPLPRYHVVSGSGSKVSRVGHVKGMRYRAAAPGYMRVVVQRSGRVDLFAIASPEGRDWLECGGSGDDLERCMSEGERQFTTRFGMRLK